MDLFDFFFPEQAQAMHLRKIAAQRRFAVPVASSPAQRDNELAALQGDVRFLALVLTAILKRLTETQTLSLADVQDLLGEVDALDNTSDGGLEPGVLRELLGVLQQDEANLARENQAFDEIAQLHHRYRRS